MLRVSVIIPTRDGAGPLRHCLEALQPGFPADAETIVVSDGGPADPSPALRDLAGPLRLRCLHVPRGGPAYARNHGLAIAAGEFVAFTDDDCRPQPGWLEALLARATAAPARGAGGTTFNGLPGNACADAAQFVLDLVARHERESCGEVRFFPANNCAFPTEALRRVGGFDASFHTAEDRDLLRRWSAAGHQMVAAEDAVVLHYADPDLAGFVRKFFGYGRGAARFHRTDAGGSVGDSASFHLNIPHLAWPGVRARGPWRGATLAALLAVWEVANTAGLLAGIAARDRRSSPSNGSGR